MPSNQPHYAFGPTLLRRTDLDGAIAHIERLVEAGKVEGFVTIALVSTAVEGVFKVEMSTLGIEPRQAFAMVCTARKGMRTTMGFVEHD